MRRERGAQGKINNIWQVLIDICGFWGIPKKIDGQEVLDKYLWIWESQKDSINH